VPECYACAPCALCTARLPRVTRAGSFRDMQAAHLLWDAPPREPGPARLPICLLMRVIHGGVRVAPACRGARAAQRARVIERLPGPPDACPGGAADPIYSACLAYL
jgi:hypothetical protein